MTTGIESPKQAESLEVREEIPGQSQPESLEYDEAGLKELVDKAHAEVDAEQAQVFEKADTKVESVPAS
jgi:hypothetical protein